MLANNISTAELNSAASATIGLLGNSLLITIVNLSLNELVVPPATRWLARIKYGLRDTPALDSAYALGFFKTVGQGNKHSYSMIGVH